MDEFKTTEMLESESHEQQSPLHSEGYTPRPKYQIVLAWILAIIVIFAFLGTCYWLAFFKV